MREQEEGGSSTCCAEGEQGGFRPYVIQTHTPISRAGEEDAVTSVERRG